MFVVNTDFVPGRRIAEALGLVCGQGLGEAGFFESFKEGFSKVQLIAKARQDALNTMCQEAQEIGANAVINVTFQAVKVVDSMSDTIIMATGTAVRLSENQERSAIEQERKQDEQG